MVETSDSQSWQAVGARALAFLALHQAGLRDKDLATQGQFLETLGLSRREAAALLGTTLASLAELTRLARKKRKGGSGAKAKRSTKR
jgi:hypothetical protein